MVYRTIPICYKKHSSSSWKLYGTARKQTTTYYSDIPPCTRPVPSETNIHVLVLLAALLQSTPVSSFKVYDYLSDFWVRWYLPQHFLEHCNIISRLPSRHESEKK